MKSPGSRGLSLSMRSLVEDEKELPGRMLEEVRWLEKLTLLFTPKEKGV